MKTNINQVLSHPLECTRAAGSFGQLINNESQQRMIVVSKPAFERDA